MDNIKKILDKCFSDAAWRQPSVIVLDDLDLICGAPAGPEQEMTGDAIYFTRVAQGEWTDFKSHSSYVVLLIGSVRNISVAFGSCKLTLMLKNAYNVIQ